MPKYCSYFEVLIPLILYIWFEFDRYGRQLHVVAWNSALSDDFGLSFFLSYWIASLPLRIRWLSFRYIRPSIWPCCFFPHGCADNPFFSNVDYMICSQVFFSFFQRFFFCSSVVQCVWFYWEVFVIVDATKNLRSLRPFFVRLAREKRRVSVILNKVFYWSCIFSPRSNFVFFLFFIYILFHFGWNC